jgi:hypothetical protein
MLATWPMVFGALVAGLIAGFLLPEMKQKPVASSVVAAKAPASVKTIETAKTPEPKTPAPVKTIETVKTPEPIAPAPAQTKDAAATAPKTVENEDCERQTWPYLTPNCMDRSARAATPDVVVKTKVDETKPENEPRSVTGGEPKSTPTQSPATTTSATPTSDSAPTGSVAATKNTPASPAPAPKVDTTATKSAAASPSSNEVKQEPAAQAAAPAPEKTARRPAARPRPEARAEVLDEPLRPRTERYRDRGERRYAGRIYEEDDRPVYIERGGRLYLAPEYQHRLRGPERYWREW